MAAERSKSGAGALIDALPLAAVALAGLEFTRAPATGLAGAAVLLESCFTAFTLTALAILVLAGCTLVRVGRPLALAAGSLLVGGVVASTLAAGPGFRFHPVTIALALGVAVFCLLAVGQLERRSWVAGGALAVLGCGLSRAHYGVLSGHYPNVHAAALVLALLLVAFGFALGGSAAPRVRLGGPAALLLLAGLVLAPSDSPSRAGVMSLTELGRGAGVARALWFEREQLLPTEVPTPTLLATEDGAAIFARHSGLPSLPPDFDLSEHDVLLVLIDAARHDRAMQNMPNLRALAARSLSFSRAMAPSNGTFPSVASMMAMAPVSLAELDIRPRFWRGRLRPERQTAAEAMRLAGRSTFWVGHDHRGCFTDNIRGLEQGFDHVERVFQAHGQQDADVDEAIATRAIARMDGLLDGPDERRFFGLVFFVSPHDDYQPHGGGATDELGRYDAELTFADHQLGRLIEAVPEGTVVIVAGDHGEAFGEHGQRHHLSSVHREQIHVPLVVHVPTLAPAASSVPTSTIYVLPWLLDRGSAPERAAAARVFADDLGPWMHALSGAVASEMIGPRAQGVSFAVLGHDVVYDVFADLTRIYDARVDPAQQHDLRESRPALLARFAPLTRRYRATRFAGQRFRFVGAPP